MKKIISKIRFSLWCMEIDLLYFLDRFNFETAIEIISIAGTILMLVAVIHPEWIMGFIPEISISLSPFEFGFLIVFGSYILGLIIGLIILIL